MKTFFILVLLAPLFGLSAATTHAQQATPDEVSSASAPSAPVAIPVDLPIALPSTPAPDPSANPKDDRIFLIMPNYGTIETNTDNIAPLSAGEKFKLAAEGNFDPYSFALVGIVAGFGQADNDDVPWGQGLKGYGHRYAATFADSAIGGFMTTGVLPTMLHEDPRYFRKGSGGFLRRTGYALKRLAIAPTDSGGRTFNFSEFGGNAVAGALSMTYHSSEDRGLTNFLGNWGTQVSLDFVADELKEFWPDIHHRFSGR